MDPHHPRRDDLLAEAAKHRLARGFRRPGPALRLYMWLWWASRPRVERWPRGVLEA